jgi:hypothetical protein
MVKIDLAMIRGLVRVFIKANLESRLNERATYN